MNRIWGTIALCAVAALTVSLPAKAQYAPPKQVTLSPTGVNIANRKHKYTYKAVDISVGPLTLERSYLSGHAVDGSTYFGLNWTHNYSAFAVEGEYGKAGKTYIVIGGSRVGFTNWNTYYANSDPSSFGSTLQLVSGAFVYTDPQGNVYTFTSSVNAFTPIGGYRNQRIAQIDYANGHRLTYTYNASAQLVQIASNSGYSLVFEYGTSGYVSKACGYNRSVTYVSASTTCSGAAPAVSYGYAAATWMNLTSVTDVMGQAWGYTYEGTSNVSKMTCVQQVNSSSCLTSMAYTEDGLVQTLADGGVWTYNYVGTDPSDPQLPGDPPAYSSANYDAPLGLTVSAVFGSGLLNTYTEGFLANPSDPWSGTNRTTTLGWDGTELASLQHQEGNVVNYIRDLRQNVLSETWTPKAGSSLSPVSNASVYPDSASSDCTTVVRKICNKPVSKTDYNGNQTDFTYDPAHGGVLTETGPAGADGVRPVKRYAYVQRYAWVSNGAGYVQATAPMWLVSTEKTCRTSATVSGACAAGVSDEVTTAYDYGPDTGPNNLLVRGKAVTADGQTLRVCYGYDGQGNRISETAPNAGLTVCP